MEKTVYLILSIVMLISCVGCSKEETHNHSYGEWKIVDKPTCTEIGEMECICNCGSKQVSTIPQTGHTIEKIDAVKATCTTDGSTMSTYCTACGEIIEKPQTIPAAHQYDDGKITTEATCAADGEKTFTCSVCGYVKTETIPKVEHNYETKITKEATCAKEGEKTHTCSACGDIKTEVIEKVSHNYVAKVTKKATCTAEGTQTYTCSVCKDKYTESISALGHTWKNATCTTAKKCSTCGRTEGKALGHTCTSGTCDRCNKEINATPTVMFSKSYYNIYYLYDDGQTVTSSSKSSGVLDNLNATAKMSSNGSCRIELILKGNVKRVEYSPVYLSFYLYIYDADGNEVLGRTRVNTLCHYKGEAISIYKTVSDLQYSTSYKIIIQSW